MTKKFFSSLLLVLFVLSAGFIYSQNLDTVKAGKFDNGKMWTFDYPPADYLNETYGFRPTQEWLDNVRMAALRFATYCSASFISADGLVMTNHHCGRESVTEVEQKGEDLHKNGFIALKLEDERKVAGLFVDQLIKIIDVTKDIHDAIDAGQTNDEKIKNKEKKIKEIEAQNTQPGIKAQVVTLYSGGGLYSLYIYKRYNDIRLVFAPEDQAGFFGGDPDNFTYPRYNLDCTFFRVYDENGKPLKTNNYYRWSQKGATTGEPIFVVGNPGRTSRLNTVAQLEYKRDVSYPDVDKFLDFMVDYYKSVIAKDPSKAKELNDRLFSYSNSQKVYKGILKGLNDGMIMAKKKDFEKKFREAVESNPGFKTKYSGVWENIASVNKEVAKLYPEFYCYRINPNLNPSYFIIADKIISSFKASNTPSENDVKALFANADKVYDEKVLEFLVERYISKLGKDNANVKALTGGNSGTDAVNYILNNTVLTSFEKTMELVNKGADAFMNSGDPIISYVANSRERFNEINKKIDEQKAIEKVNNELLGQAIYEVFGTTIPPDATFTLRISDGVIKSYEYNGTIAPTKTTFYGIYDRYYSFGKEFPFNLPDRWINPPKEFNLSAPFNFISTNDIIGGNSGSPMINKNAEIVGLAFDGNMESLTDEFIYLDDKPHTVSVDSEGLFEVVKNLYKIDRLAYELRNGKMK
ncbi:MAG: S46 family peptidase [Ignavibacteriae bacterium]|nr:S46 family peptidase [Ignavibacteriota bacterium]